MVNGKGAWALLAASLSFGGCVEQPGAERIVGPDGTHMLHVHCPDEQVACFQIAGERCPNGYDLSPIFDPHDGNFLVRCREPRAAAGIATATVPPARGGAVSSASPNDRWPPAEVATPTEPWPTPANVELPPTPHSANGNVDIGY
jgi:hypothetical protein